MNEYRQQTFEIFLYSFVFYFVCRVIIMHEAMSLIETRMAASQGMHLLHVKQWHCDLQEKLDLVPRKLNYWKSRETDCQSLYKFISICHYAIQHEKVLAQKPPLHLAEFPLNLH